MKTVEIPGGTAEVREPSELRGRDKLLIKACAMAASSALAKTPDLVREDDESDESYAARLSQGMEDVTLTWQESLAMLELRQATVVATLVSWSLPEKLPTMETIGDLPSDLYDALEEAVSGATPDAIELETDFRPTPDQASPTSASDGSNGPSEANQPNPSTDPPSNDGVPTDGESSSPAQ